MPAAINLKLHSWLLMPPQRVMSAREGWGGGLLVVDPEGQRRRQGAASHLQMKKPGAGRVHRA